MIEIRLKWILCTVLKNTLCVFACFAQVALGNPDHINVVTAEKICIEGENLQAIFEYAELQFLAEQLSLSADRFSIDTSSSEPVAHFDGNVSLSWPDIQLYASKGHCALNTHQGHLSSIHYHLASILGIGSAREASWNDEMLSLIDTTYCTCTKATPFWSVAVHTLSYAFKTKYIVLRGLTLKCGPIPIFYWPYLAYTLTDQGIVGFLGPFGMSQATPPFAYRSTKEWQIGLPVGWQFSPSSRWSWMPLWHPQNGLSLHVEGTVLHQKVGAFHGLCSLAVAPKQMEALRPYTVQMCYETPDQSPLTLQANAYRASDLKTAQATERLPELPLQFEDANYFSWTLRHHRFNQHLTFRHLNAAPFSSDLCRSAATECINNAQQLLHGEYVVQRSTEKEGEPSPLVSLQTCIETLYYVCPKEEISYNYWYIEPQMKGNVSLKQLQLGYQLHLRTAYAYHGNEATAYSQQYTQVKPAVQLSLSLPLLLTTAPLETESTIQITPTFIGRWIPTLDLPLPNRFQISPPAIGDHELFAAYPKLTPLYQQAFSVTECGCACRSTQKLHKNWIWSLSFGHRAVWEPCKADQPKDNVKNKLWLVHGDLFIQPYHHGYAQFVMRSAGHELEQLIFRYTFQQGHKRFFQASYFYLPSIVSNYSSRPIQQLGGSIAHPITTMLSLVGRYHYAISHGHMVEAFYGLHVASECFEIELCYNSNLAKPAKASHTHLSYDTKGIMLSFRWLGWGQANKNTPLDLLKNGRLKPFPVVLSE